jgi:hypothetical protein
MRKFKYLGFLPAIIFVNFACNTFALNSKELSEKSLSNEPKILSRSERDADVTQDVALKVSVSLSPRVC